MSRREVLEALRFRHFPMPVRLQLSSGGDVLELGLTVPERERGHRTEVVGRRFVPHDASDADFVNLVFKLVVDFTTHEVGEHLQLAGVRVFDPHAGAHNRELVLADALDRIPAYLEARRPRLPVIFGPRSVEPVARISL